MYTKEYETEKGPLIAACDRELLGKTLKYGDLEFKVSKEFYGGKAREIEELPRLVKECSHANIIGKKTIGFLKKRNMVKESAIIYIDGIPHVLIVKV